jgi:hypothetical protein
LRLAMKAAIPSSDRPAGIAAMRAAVEPDIVANVAP